MNITYLLYFYLFFEIVIVDTLLIKNKNIKNEIYNKYSIHKKLNYKNARKILHSELNDIIIYGNQTYKKNINCEHIWCRTYFDYKEPMNSDLHILYLANAKLNSHRQAYKFNEIYSNYTLLDEYGNKINNITGLDITKLCKKNTKNKVFEPPDISKGKIARSCAYFMLVYPEYSHYLPELIDVNILVKWNRNYKVDYKEIYKNEMINVYQKNINPFIKYPILVELFFSNEIDLLNIYKLSIITIFTIIISLFMRLYIKIYMKIICNIYNGK
jgi:endonuclease I